MKNDQSLARASIIENQPWPLKSKKSFSKTRWKSLRWRSIWKLRRRLWNSSSRTSHGHRRSKSWGSSKTMSPRPKLRNKPIQSTSLRVNTNRVNYPRLRQLICSGSTRSWNKLVLSPSCKFKTEGGSGSWTRIWISRRRTGWASCLRSETSSHMSERKESSSSAGKRRRYSHLRRSL